MLSTINLFLFSLLIGSLAPYEMSATSGGGGGGGSSKPHHGKAPRGLRDGVGGDGGSGSRAPGDGESTSTRWSQKEPTLCTLCQGIADAPHPRWVPIPYHILPIDGASTCDMCGNIEYPDEDEDGRRRSKRVRRAGSHVSDNSLAMLALAAHHSPPASPVATSLPASAAGGGVGAAAGGGAGAAAGHVADDSSDEDEDDGGDAREYPCRHCNAIKPSHNARFYHEKNHFNQYDPHEHNLCLLCDPLKPFKIGRGPSIFDHLAEAHDIDYGHGTHVQHHPSYNPHIKWFGKSAVAAAGDFSCTMCDHKAHNRFTYVSHQHKHSDPVKPTDFLCKICKTHGDNTKSYKAETLQWILKHLYDHHVGHPNLPAREDRAIRLAEAKTKYAECIKFPTSDDDGAGEGSPDTTGGGGSGAPAGGGSGAGAGGGGSGRVAAV